jgi:hypothetical protein
MIFTSAAIPFGTTHPHDEAHLSVRDVRRFRRIRIHVISVWIPENQTGSASGTVAPIGLEIPRQIGAGRFRNPPPNWRRSV